MSKLEALELKDVKRRPTPPDILKRERYFNLCVGSEEHLARQRPGVPYTEMHSNLLWIPTP